MIKIVDQIVDELEKEPEVGVVSDLGRMEQSDFTVHSNNLRRFRPSKTATLISTW